MTGFRSTLFLVLIFLSAFLKAQSDQEIDWNYELDLMGRELAERHCGLFFHRDSSYFFDALNQIADNTGGHTLFDVSVRVQQLLAKMGDPQTRINYHFNINSGHILPLDLYWFEEGIYVLECNKEHRQILGTRIIAVNGTPLRQVIDSLSTLLVHEYPYLLRDQLPRMLTWTPLLEYFGFSAGNRIRLSFVDEQGIEGAVVIPLSDETKERVRIDLRETALAWEDRTSYFREHYLPEEKTYYIQYNKCWSREVEETHGSGASALFMPSFKEFEKRVIQNLRRNRIEKLVLDLRFNDGGQPDQGNLLIRKMSRIYPRGEGRCYLIVGRRTQGAALENAVEFTAKTGASVFGEPSGGKPNHFSGVKRFVLPESGLVVNYSTRYISLVQGDPSSLQPDLETPLSYLQYLSGSDPAMEAIFMDVIP
jgi:hypothetical protein